MEEEIKNEEIKNEEIKEEEDVKEVNIPEEANEEEDVKEEDIPEGANFYKRYRTVASYLSLQRNKRASSISRGVVILILYS
ncbi:hypothetical protein ACFL0H_14215, partial [Thermodesulfobacteriota bacterium]